MVGLTNALIASGWLSQGDAAVESLSALPVGADVLPVLVEAARQQMETQDHAKASTPKVRSDPRLPSTDVLDEAMRRGARLTLGWPEREGRPLDRWLGPRLLWWPSGIPEGRKVTWVSSRLGRAIDERPDWFAVLRSAVAKLEPKRDLLLTAPSTTVDRFLERAAILFGLRRLRVHLDERHTLVDWLARLRQQLWRNSLAEVPLPESTDDSKVFVSPTFKQTDEPECPFSNFPLSDRMLIAVADHVLALQVRPKGNLHQLLRARLSDSVWPTASVWLALGESLVSAEIASELQSLGAVGWWLFASDAANVRQLNPAPNTTDASCVGHDFFTELPWHDGEYFVHWTRRRNGPWPGEADPDFLDDLLLSRDSANHSAFATLSRIVQQRQLIASATGIRGETAVVSFSAKPLLEVTKQRTFRSHRGRWDCEAYGLCLRREWLHARGIKPVIYGDDDVWSSLPNSDRPFFQLKTTRSRRGAKTIDWTQEVEWRIPNDLDLSKASSEDVLLFVPTEDEARQLAAISPWPVLVLSRSAQVS